MYIYTYHRWYYIYIHMHSSHSLVAITKQTEQKQNSIKETENKKKMAASSFNCSSGSSGILYLSLFFFALHFCTVLSVEFKVGGDKGWVIPPSNDAELFNEWASKNRFKINDTLRFIYEKDSVLEVTQAEYEKCRSTHPLFFGNNGNTSFTLNRGGLFYFISGVSGHCQRYLKIIIKVLEPETPPPLSPPAGNQTTDTSGAVELVSSSTSVMTAVIMFVSSLFGAVFI